MTAAADAHPDLEKYDIFLHLAVADAAEIQAGTERAARLLRLARSIEDTHGKTLKSVGGVSFAGGRAPVILCP